MGVVKLLLPRHMYFRGFLPANRDWKRNTGMAWLQIMTLTVTITTGLSAWGWSPPRKGQQLLDPNVEYARPIPIL